MILKTEFDIFSVQNWYKNIERGKEMQNLKRETLTWFKELDMNFPGLIKFRIKSGKTCVNAKAMLIKNVAFDDLQVLDCLAASSTCKTVYEAPLPTQMRNDSP